MKQTLESTELIIKSLQQKYASVQVEKEQEPTKIELITAGKELGGSNYHRSEHLSILCDIIIGLEVLGQGFNE